MTLLFYLLIDFVAIFFVVLAVKVESGYQKSGDVLVRKRPGVIIITKSEILLALSALVLFLVAAFRDETVGVDYATYAEAYKSVNNSEIATVREINWLGRPFIFFCKIIGIIAPQTPALMFAMCSFITIYYLYKSIYCMSKDWCLSLYMFISFCLYYQSFNQFRQILAIVLSVYAIKFLVEDRKLVFIFFVILASCFHTSALVMLVLLVVNLFAIDTKTLMIYFLGTLGCYIGFDYVIYLLSFTNYGKTYLNWSVYNTSFEMSSILNLVVRLAVLVFCLFFYKVTIKRNSKLRVFYHTALICTALQVLTLKSYLFGRVTTYFFMPYIFLLPEVMETIKVNFSSKNYVLIKYIVYIVLFFYHIVYYFSETGASGSGYDVYDFIFFN